jgi:hypothetical protein
MGWLNSSTTSEYRLRFPWFRNTGNLIFSSSTDLAAEHAIPYQEEDYAIIE